MIKFIQSQIEKHKRGKLRHQNNLAAVAKNKLEDPYGIRSLVFYEDQVGSTIIRSRVLRRENHGNLWSPKSNFTNVIVEYVYIRVISQTECKVISVKEVKEYIPPSSKKGGGGIQSAIRDKANMKARNW